MSTFLEESIQRVRQSYFDELANNIVNMFSTNSIIDSVFAKNELSDSFEKFLKSMYTHKFEFNPLSGGFSLFLLIPPHLSAEEYEEFFGKPFSTSENNEQDYFYNTVYSIPFIADEFSPPPFSVKIEENKLINGAIPLAEEVTPANQMNVSYYETKDLMVYSLHSIWLKYIEEVKLGKIKPNDYYIENGILDYAAAAFILRFDQNLNVSYLGYVIGMVLNSLNPQDIVQQKIPNDIAKVNIPYSLFWYTEFTYYELTARGYTIKEPNGHPYLEKLKQLLSVYYK